MGRHFCLICNKRLFIGSYKARKMHINGSKHKQMLRTHYLEVLEDEDIRKELECLSVLGPKCTNKNVKSIRNTRSFFMPPMALPSDFKIPPAPKGFKLPSGFDFENVLNFDADLGKAIKKVASNRL